MKTDILGLLPPTASDPAQDRWQRAMAAAVICLIGAIAASSTALGAGLYRASAERADIRGAIDDLTKLVKDEGRLSRMQSIEGNIAAMQTRYCEAVRTGNRQNADSLNESISALQARYMMLDPFGLPYPVRACA